MCIVTEDGFAVEKWMIKGQQNSRFHSGVKKGK